MTLVDYSSSDESVDSPLSLESCSVPSSNQIQSAVAHKISQPENVIKTYAGTFEKVYTTKRIDVDRPISKRAKKRQRKAKGEPGDDYLGPWAGYSDDDQETKENDYQEPLSLDHQETNGIKEETIGDLGTLTSLDPSESSSSQSDMLSELFVKDLCIDFTRKAIKTPAKFITPTKITYKFNDPSFFHANGITKLRLIPRTAHLLLSGGNDSKIYLWDIGTTTSSSLTPRCLRGYYGHRQAIRDLCFNNKGTQFISCSFDRSVIIWDTASGKLVRKFNLQTVPNCVIFNPNDNNEFIVGLANHKIDHYRIDGVNPIQSYTHHLGPVNTLTVIDNGKAFMSTADDKSVRFWNWNIDNPIKVIADPSSYSVPNVAINFKKDIVALQSMDNSIHFIQAVGKFKNIKRSLKGHQVAGYSVDLAFSGDSSHVISGDSRGTVHIWNWMTCKMIKTIKIGSKPVQTLAVHPFDKSKVFVGGPNGEIYILQN